MDVQKYLKIITENSLQCFKQIFLSQNSRANKLYLETTNLGFWISDLLKHEKEFVLVCSCVETGQGDVRRTYIEDMNSVYYHTFANTEGR
jgi:hypothetical protein